MFKKNTAVTGFPISLVSKTDGSAITTGTPSGYYLLDGGTQGAIAGSFTHEGNGQWSVNLLAAEMNGDIVGLLFTHASAVPVHFTIKTVTKLASELNDISSPVTVGTINSGVITAASIAADAITAAKIADGAIDAATFAAGAINAAAIATDAIDADALKADAVAEIQSGLSTLNAAGVRSAVGLASANLDTQLDALPTNAELATALGTADDATLAAIAALNNLSAAAVNAEVDTALADVGLTTTITGRIDAAISSRLASGSYTAPPTAAENADAVWEEVIADHSGTTGSTAEALGAAGAAGDPWTTALPGAYGAGSAGKIIGDNINATISSRASQSSVDDLPTNAELATSQAAADDATLAAIAALNNLSAAQVNAEVDTALADYDAPTKAELDSAVASLATATAVDALPTNAELATALAAADDATLSAVAALSIPSANSIADAVLSRGVSNVEDTADTTSLAALILATFESSASGTTWTIRKSAGGTFVVKTLTLDDTADPVTGVT